MIARYTRPEMGRIWSDENKFRSWLEVELAASEALAELGVVPPDAARLLRTHAGFDVARIHAIEKEVRHDVIAFTTAVSESMAAAGVLDLSVAKDPRGNALVYHANYRDRCRATELELPSLYRKLSDSASRNAIGRANRYLIWSDMLRYKAQGLKYFDFGGWYPGTADPALLKINEFKRGFGGQVVRAYQCEQILTLKGWLVLRVARLLKQTKLFPSGQGKPAADSPPPAVRHPVAAPSA